MIIGVCYSSSLFIFLCLTRLSAFVRCLQEANDTLKAEVKRLKEAVDEKEKDMELFKVNRGRVEKQWTTNKEIQDRVNHKQVCFL